MDKTLTCLGGPFDGAVLHINNFKETELLIITDEKAMMRRHRISAYKYNIKLKCLLPMPELSNSIVNGKYKDPCRRIIYSSAKDQPKENE